MSSLFMRKQQKSAEVYKQYAQQQGAEILYWATLLIILTANLLLSVVLIPLLLVLEAAPLYALLVLLGLASGTLFAQLVKSISGLHMHHHILALLFLPTIALLDILVISSISQKIGSVLQLQPTVSPILLALTYVIAMLLPYLVVKKN